MKEENMAKPMTTKDKIGMDFDNLRYILIGQFSDCGGSFLIVHLVSPKTMENRAAEP